MTGEAPPWIIINQFSGLDPGYAQIWILRFGMAQHSNLHQWMEIWCFQQETQVHWYPPSLMVKSPIYNINGINPSCFSRLNGSNHVKHGNMMVKRPTTVWCLNPIMWLKQCNKPAMTGNGLSIAPTQKCFFFFWGMVRLCIDHWEFTHQKLWEFTQWMVPFSCRDDRAFLLDQTWSSGSIMAPSSGDFTTKKRTSCNQGTRTVISAVWNKSWTFSFNEIEVLVKIGMPRSRIMK